MITKEGYKRFVNFLIWCFFAFIISIIGITDVLAWDWTNANGITYTAIGYVTNDTQIQIEVAYETSSGAPLQVAVDQTVNTEIKTLYINLDNYNFLANTRYELELNLPNNKLVYANSYNVKGNNGEQCLISLSDSVFKDEYSRFDFQCPSATNSIAISVYNSNNTAITQSGIFSWHYSHLYSSTMSINSSTTNNNDLINNANQNADRVINNQNQNTQDIINNQNQNSQNIQNTINNNFQTCKPSPNILNIPELLKESNYNVSNNYKYAVGFVPKTSRSKYYVYAKLKDGKSRINNFYVWLSQSGANPNNGYNRYLVSNGYVNSYSSNYAWWANRVYFTFTPTNVSLETIFDHYEFMVTEEQLFEYYPYGEICTNRLDEQTNAINDLNDSINDDNVDDNGVASAFDSFNDFLDDNSTITQLITLPITLYTAILNNLNGTCQPFNLGKLYGEDLILPCINISQYLGSTLWTMIDVIISGFAIYAISKKMIKVFNNFSSLREGDVIDD